MKLTCDEATQICDKSQYSEATFWEKLKLNLHLLLCKNCGLYSKQNNVMTKCYEKHKKEEGNKHCLCADEKEVMEKQIKEKI
ncbi:hypothetical protein BX611_0775 [Lutibacter oceani]|uniref:Glycine dehydrogenase n=1 Tax=Lutibacter oceani TaxID=1853311 RepID=A0A3D9S0Y0_9FLAO|nr:hypothetical protein [Lutibacter oceani]REE83484.1 hypothetical protein BX611_0775 [Lutibacter oceani]